ncbi:MAG: protein kinase [Acidobacteriota bacterium]
MAQPRTIGPYRILKPIGQGGMGVVYLAMHRETTERVALKTVRVPETAMLATLRREIHALARLDHPRIVKVVADGVEDGVPWYAMELLDGTSLADYIQSVFVAFEDERWDPTSTEGTDPLEGASARTDRTVALPPPERITGEVTATPPPPGGARVEAAGGELVAALTIARRLCDPLAYLHGEGIVHRDLKPANILIKADGAPVLVDFGLTASFTGEESRDHVEVAGMISGTAAYMAPEQARGQIVDARADLYSLGCILYELLCGQPPFLGDHPASLVHQHVNTIPRPPSARASGVPAALDALLMRLLAKDPRDRHGYAVDVARALEEMGARPGASPGPPPRVYLHRPGLAGREDVESALLGRLRRVQEGHGGLQLLAGPAGTGKTRIAAEIASRARARHMRVIPCAADEALRAAPFHLLRPVLQAIADERRLGGDAATRLVASDTGVLADYEPSLAEPPGPARATRPSLSAEQGKLRVFDALSAALSSMTGRGSVVLVMDDVQWADDLSLAYLDHVVRTGALASARVLLLATYRGEEAGAAIRTMRDLGAPCLDLGPLDLGAVGAMVRDMLALPSAGAAFASFLYRQSEGNPLFVAEYLRHAVLEGILTRDATGVWRFEGGAGMDAPSFEGIRLPGSLRQLLGRRMAGLGGAARELLEIVSVMGRGADAALLAPTSGLDEVVFLELLADLARRNVLRADGPNIEIAHERLREIALAGLPHEKRRAIHAAIAQAMEAVTEPERSMRLPDVARHWEGAGELDRARATYLACARSAERRYAIEEAGRLYRQYLALADAATEEAVGARLELWYAVLRLLGPLDEAETHLRRIVDDARVLGLPRREAEGLGGLGVVLGHVGRSGEAVASFEAALAIARASDERMFEGVLCGNFGGLLSRLGRGDEARPLFERQREIHRALGQAESEAMAIASMAHLELASGDLPRARDLYDEALGILRGSGARQTRAWSSEGQPRSTSAREKSRRHASPTRRRSRSTARSAIAGTKAWLSATSRGLLSRTESPGRPSLCTRRRWRSTAQRGTASRRRPSCGSWRSSSRSSARPRTRVMPASAPARSPDPFRTVAVKRARRRRLPRRTSRAGGSARRAMRTSRCSPPDARSPTSISRRPLSKDCPRCWPRAAISPPRGRCTGAHSPSARRRAAWRLPARSDGRPGSNAPPRTPRRCSSAPRGSSVARSKGPRRSARSAPSAARAWRSECRLAHARREPPRWLAISICPPRALSLAPSRRSRATAGPTGRDPTAGDGTLSAALRT